MKPGHDPLTLAQLQRRFSDEAKCLEFLERARWPDGPVCPRCGSIGRVSRLSTRREMTCLECEHQFTVTAGTPMHKTHLPIRTWIIAAYLLTTSSKGISSLKLASLLGLQYRTTWHLAHRIRAMMADAPDLLRGIVELDETCIGGKGRKQNKPQPPASVPLFEAEPKAPPPQKRARRRRRGRGPDKPMAFTAVERGGKARMSVLATHSTEAIAQFVFNWLARSAIISTDELPAYLGVGRMQAGHIRVNHSAEEFARDDARTGLRAHVNTAESLHALLKRAIVGVWHWISVKHLERYLAETTFHWNQRGPFEDRLATVFGAKHGPLPLRALLA